MRCPVCLDTELVPHIRDGIEVDHCPRCRGLWLDRGELEKLLDLAEARSPEPRITSPGAPGVPGAVGGEVPRVTRTDQRRWDEHDDERDERRGGRRRKRKGAFAELLEEVFEVFD